MNWIDIVFIILFIKSAVEGFSRGLILSFFRTAGMIMALYAGIFYRDRAVEILKVYFPIKSVVSTILKMPQDPGVQAAGALGFPILLEMAIGAIGFLLVFSIVQLIFLIPAYFLHGLTKATQMSFINRGLGLIFAVGRTILAIGLVAAIATPFLIALPDSWLAKSLNGSHILQNIKFLDFITPIVVKFI
ncbi:MAG TPA: CvpA family protein [Thermoanaerobacterales bacterium]|jgi:uncharacterized membrane protein required for colicin V production|nr:CvpA family protein [Thermoanaerobacterales bacterium]